MEVQISKANTENAETVVSLVKRLLQDFNEQSRRNFNIDHAQLLAVTKELITRENFAAYLAYDPNNFAAYLAYDPNNKAVGLITVAQAMAIYNSGDFGVITELYVEKNHRSMGIGEQLLHAAFEFAREKSWKKVEVGAPDKAEWPRTLAFYKRNGFTEKGPKLRIEL